jgi:hypothetical protein
MRLQTKGKVLILQSCACIKCQRFSHTNIFQNTNLHGCHFPLNWLRGPIHIYLLSQSHFPEFYSVNLAELTARYLKSHTTLALTTSYWLAVWLDPAYRSSPLGACHTIAHPLDNALSAPYQVPCVMRAPVLPCKHTQQQHKKRLREAFQHCPFLQPITYDVNLR